MPRISIYVDDNVYALMKVLVGEQETESEYGYPVEKVAESLTNWAVRGLVAGATGPAPFRYPLTIEAQGTIHVEPRRRK